MTPKAVSPATTFAERVRLWGTAILAAAGVFTLLGSVAIKFATNDIRSDLRDLHDDVRAFSNAVKAQQYADSVRFERVIEVVEVAVVAIVEPSDSPARNEAVAKLRRKQGLAINKE